MPRKADRTESGKRLRRPVMKQPDPGLSREHRPVVIVALILALLLLTAAAGTLIYDTLYPGGIPEFLQLGRLLPDTPNAGLDGVRTPSADDPAETEDLPDTHGGETGSTEDEGDGRGEEGTEQEQEQKQGAPDDNGPSDKEHLLAPSGAEASSALSPQGGNTYGPGNALDSNMETAWNEGASGSGNGEWIRLHFPAPVVPTRLEIANGYQKDQRRFRGNGRIRRLRIELGGEASLPLTVELEDALGYQSVDLPADYPATSEIILTIISVYPGDTWEDTALSGMRIYGYSETE